jgi:trehalose 6-phosphate synthase
MTPADYWSTLVRYSPLGLLSDLDGTLLPFAPTPAEARPTPELLELLGRLVELPNLKVAVVSGRLREQLDAMFGAIPGLYLAAEHGAWLRRDGAWEATAVVEPAEFATFARELEAIASAAPGALVEKKTGSVCLHVRRVRRHVKEALLVQAMAAMEGWCARHPGHEVVEGVETLETRSLKIRKSIAVPWLRERLGAGGRLLAAGDDTTDEDMFAALAPTDEALLVGPPPRRRTAARWRLDDPARFAAFLRALVDVRRDVVVPTRAVVPVALAPRASQRAAASAATRYRLIVLSNRLPNLRSAVASDEERHRNVGGLVSALEPVLRERHGLWLGWSGRTVAGEAVAMPLVAEDAAPPIASIDLPDAWHKHYYNGLCNRGLWPLFHSFPSRVHFVDADWDAYVRVNAAFAECVREMVEPDAAVWVHDYHLLLVAEQLRQRGHRGPIGLFLHIPFPSPDLFSMLPWSDRVVCDMLAFDLLGFHTPAYVENFRQCAAGLLSACAGDDVVEHKDRRTRVAAFPIGIIPEHFEPPADAATAEEVASILRSIAPTRLILGVDRLDYTKGIAERLGAFARLLELHPEWRRKVSFIQVSVPSRADVPDYAEQRSTIESIVGRINGEYGEASWTPVRYVYRSYERPQLVALYRAAAVGYVTPLRDGMNLVAKEFVAAQDPKDPGVLLLSRFAGAAVELHDALLTNPFHPEGMARDLDRALRMVPEERIERHAKLDAAVRRSTAVTWAEDYLAALGACR